MKMERTKKRIEHAIATIAKKSASIDPRKSELCVSFEDWKKTGRNAPKGQCHIIGRSRSRGVWLGKLWEQSAGDVYYTADRILLWLSAGKFFAMVADIPLEKECRGISCRDKEQMVFLRNYILVGSC